MLDYPNYFLREQEVPLSGEGLLFRILHHPVHGIPAHRLAIISQELYRNVRHRRKAPQTLRDYLHQLRQANEGRLFPLGEDDGALMQAEAVLLRLEEGFKRTGAAGWTELLSAENLLSALEAAWINEAMGGGLSDTNDHRQVFRFVGEKLAVSDAEDAEPATLPKPDPAFLEQLLSGFRLSVSALNQFLSCPIRFYYETLLRAPGGSSEAAQYGSSMHDAVDRYYSKMMAENRTYPSPDELLQFFRADMEAHRTCFRPERMSFYLQKGEQGLRAFHAHFIEGRAEEFIRTEVRLEAKIDGVPVKGFIDKMQYSDGEVTITDFKTGNMARCDARLDFAPAGLPGREEGGNYWRQAVVYKLLFDQQRNNYRELQPIEFLFIEPNESGNFDRRRITISPDDEAAVRQQIRSTWARIQDHDFFTGCGKAGCSWCELIRLREAKR
jgi:hypothetical protein